MKPFELAYLKLLAAEELLQRVRKQRDEAHDVANEAHYAKQEAESEYEVQLKKHLKTLAGAK